MNGKKYFFLKVSDFSFSQGYLVEGQILKKFFKKFQKKPEKQLPTSHRELEGIKTFLPRSTKQHFSSPVI